ncbi:MAG: Na-K-Cl cotransporter, partial [Cyanobacteria bacterium J06626_18]
WRDAEIHLKLVVADEQAAAATEKNMNNLIQDLRIMATVHTITANGQSFDDILSKSSSQADLVILGMADPTENFCAYYETVQQRITDLPSTVLVLAAPNFRFAEVLEK